MTYVIKLLFGQSPPLNCPRGLCITQKDHNRAYLIGIFTEPLRIPQCEALPVLPSKYAFVPHVLEWIRKEGGNEVDEASCIPTGKLKLGSPTLEGYTPVAKYKHQKIVDCS